MSTLGTTYLHISKGTPPIPIVYTSERSAELRTHLGTVIVRIAADGAAVEVVLAPSRPAQKTAKISVERLGSTGLQLALRTEVSR